MDEKEFALRLAQLREKKNVSAREMSLAIGQNAGYINNIESGKSLPSLPGVFYICDYLGISVSEFFDSETTNPTKLNEIINNLKKLDDRQLDTIATLVKELILK
ncbi:MAG: helix-turn-helix transcriptional regulator [Acutalibacteraceae bacterium]|nr:helix-turn-helix transcriptional regulator [Acutalibacteraceae bacterium]